MKEFLELLGLNGLGIGLFIAGLLVVTSCCVGGLRQCEHDGKTRCFNQTKDPKCWDLK